MTDRQSDCLRFIANYRHENGFPPTLREIADYLGFKTPWGVMNPINALEGKGLIEREFRKDRGLRITQSGFCELVFDLEVGRYLSRM